MENDNSTSFLRVTISDTTLFSILFVDDHVSFFPKKTEALRWKPQITATTCRLIPHPYPIPPYTYFFPVREMVLSNTG